MADENLNEHGRPPSAPTHRPPTSNIDPKTALYFVIGILVVVGLLSLGIVLLFGTDPN